MSAGPQGVLIMPRSLRGRLAEATRAFRLILRGKPPVTVRLRRDGVGVKLRGVMLFRVDDESWFDLGELAHVGENVYLVDFDADGHPIVRT